MVLELLILAALLFLSAFFSGSETAFMAVNRIKIKERVQRGDDRASRVDKLLTNQTKLLTTILIGNNLVNISASSIATALAVRLFGNKGVGIATGAVTLLILVFGEITPKALGNNKSVKYTEIAAPFLFYMGKLFAPFIFLFTKIVKIFVGDKDLISSAFLSEEEIRRFVEVSHREGIIKETEQEMIQSVFEFDDTLVKEVMIPRTDMVCIEKSAGLKELISLAVEKGHSRIPVFEESIDNIIGLIYIKDLLELLLEREKEVSIEDFVKPIYFIPEGKPINQLLSEMKKRKEHMAVVIDEYGGTAGLITIEDLLEEIVGDIQDEFDLEPKYIEFLNEKELMLDGRVDIDELNELLPNPLPVSEDYETISGLILYYLNRLPEAGDKIDLDGIEVIVEDVLDNRIRKIRLKSEDKIRLEDREW
ncbi:MULTISPECIES: hemolysin family protein [unclassified Halanaerobium]|uniref:hemolysin family protein n=1 Tax=unclassified Halanaerobium TaxID=2641197 RepID=UPI000DF13141|nr:MULTISPECIES: hemolysin family protein [unclassified Halanaerobium]RCW45386.1 CBS domain containing-hemolysin-like protein [Halanaerobium sp. MA284_MarDTE_T2]RCW82564.1 CBS domain containing-hemolysin-like protein [Halanaerobium sp. DL-01]